MDRKIMGRNTMPQLWQMKRKLNHAGKENAAGQQARRRLSGTPVRVIPCRR
jgi:hypothetical protein